MTSYCDPSAVVAAAGLVEVSLDVVPIANLTYTYADDGDGGRMLVGPGGALNGVKILNEAAITSLVESVTNGYWTITIDLTGLSDSKWGTSALAPTQAPAIVWPCFGDCEASVDGELVAGHYDKNVSAICCLPNAGTPAWSASVATNFGSWSPTRVWMWSTLWGVVKASASTANLAVTRRSVRMRREAGTLYGSQKVNWGDTWLDMAGAPGESGSLNDSVPTSAYVGVGVGGNGGDSGIILRVHRIAVTRYPRPTP